MICVFEKFWQFTCWTILTNHFRRKGESVQLATLPTVHFSLFHWKVNFQIVKHESCGNHGSIVAKKRQTIRWTNTVKCCTITKLGPAMLHWVIQIWWSVKSFAMSATGRVLQCWRGASNGGGGDVGGEEEEGRGGGHVRWHRGWGWPGDGGGDDDVVHKNDF